MLSPATIFNVQLGLGYVPWLLVFAAWVWPRLKAMEPRDAHRAIAALHAFRFFGLVFLLPGVVGPGLPAGFAAPAAYGDFAAGVLAMLALATVRVRALFWMFVAAFHLVGAADLVADYADGVRLALPQSAGELGAAYAIPMVYVPILMITHVAALRLFLRQRSRTALVPAAAE